jgi:hypothetical protein
MLRHVEINLPPGQDPKVLVPAIERAFETCGVHVTLRGTLKQHPGCVHWHVKNGRETGTLEITYWPREHRAWFTIRPSRGAKWMDGKMKLIQRALSDSPRA